MNSKSSSISRYPSCLTNCLLCFVFSMVTALYARSAESGKGDLGQFIIQKALEFGGTANTNDLPKITTEWTYKSDSAGVTILTSTNHYPAIERFVLKAFGKPRMGPTDTVDGFRFGAYRLTEKGGGIQFTYDAKNAQVIILRPIEKRKKAE